MEDLRAAGRQEGGREREKEGGRERKGDGGSKEQ